MNDSTRIKRKFKSATKEHEKISEIKIHENVIAERFRTRKQTMSGIAMNHECKHRKQGASREIQD